MDPIVSFFFSDAVKGSFEKSFKDIEVQKKIANENAGGELVYVAQKGFTRFAGVSNGHPFFI